MGDVGQQDVVVLVRPYVCSLCGRSYLRKKGLWKHSLQHKREGPYPCTTCHVNFRHSRWLKRHRSMFHKSTVRAGTKDSNTHSKAVASPKSPASTGGTPKSPATVTPKTPVGGKFKCPQCSTEFAQIAHLKRHAIAHTCEGPHSCTACKVSFTSLRGLAKHRRSKVHHREDSLTVQQDSGTSGRNDSEAQASPEPASTHVKPVKCPHCDWAFWRKDQFQKHAKSHTLEAGPNACTVCCRRFASPHALLTHVGVVHKKKGMLADCSAGRQVSSSSEKDSAWKDVAQQNAPKREGPNACTLCCKSFASPHALLTHVGVVHKKKGMLADCSARRQVKSSSSSCSEEVVPQQRSIVQTREERPMCTVCRGRFASPRGLHIHASIAHKKQRVLQDADAGSANSSSAGKSTPMKQASKSSSSSEKDSARKDAAQQNTPKREGPNACTLCCKSFASPHALLIHTGIMHKKRGVLAVVRKRVNADNSSAGKSTPARKRVKSSSSSSSEDGAEARGLPCSCGLCGKEFRYSKGLKVHEATQHPASSTFWCHICLGKFLEVDDLYDHVRSVCGLL